MDGGKPKPIANWSLMFKRSGMRFQGSVRCHGRTSKPIEVIGGTSEPIIWQHAMQAVKTPSRLRFGNPVNASRTTGLRATLAYLRRNHYVEVHGQLALSAKAAVHQNRTTGCCPTPGREACRPSSSVLGVRCSVNHRAVRRYRLPTGVGFRQEIRSGRTKPDGWGLGLPLVFPPLR